MILRRLCVDSCGFICVSPSLLRVAGLDGYDTGDAGPQQVWQQCIYIATVRGRIRRVPVTHVVLFVDYDDETNELQHRMRADDLFCFATLWTLAVQFLRHGSQRLTMSRLSVQTIAGKRLLVPGQDITGSAVEVWPNPPVKVKVHDLDAAELSKLKDPQAHAPKRRRGDRVVDRPAGPRGVRVAGPARDVASDHGTSAGASSLPDGVSDADASDSVHESGEAGLGDAGSDGANANGDLEVARDLPSPHLGQHADLPVGWGMPDAPSDESDDEPCVDAGEGDVADTAVPAAAVDPGAAAPPRAAPYARTVGFGRFTLSRISSRGRQIGWGANCNRHRNVDDRNSCRAHLVYGAVNPLTDEQCIRGLQKWIILGFTILPNDPTAPGARTRHKQISARMLAETPPGDDEDLDYELSVIDDGS